MENRKIPNDSERVLRDEELLSLRGGVKVPGEGCGGELCDSAKDCCTENPVCGYAPGNPDFMICMSP
jgi:hypothetical protein